jgi:hypothetical protein
MAVVDDQEFWHPLGAEAGPGQLLTARDQSRLEWGPAAEQTAHLGHERGDPVGRWPELPRRPPRQSPWPSRPVTCRWRCRETGPGRGVLSAELSAAGSGPAPVMTADRWGVSRQDRRHRRRSRRPRVLSGRATGSAKTRDGPVEAMRLGGGVRRRASARTADGCTRCQRARGSRRCPRTRRCRGRRTVAKPPEAR